MKQADADVSIIGGGIAGSAAALACVRLGLQTYWHRDPAASGSAWLESLAPEGGSYLRQLLTQDEIASVRQGIFRQLETEGQIRPFSPLLGEGIHLIPRTLIQLFAQNARTGGVKESGPLREIDFDGRWVRLTSRDGGIYQSRYLIDASGVRAVAARRMGLARIKLGPERFVARYPASTVLSLPPNRACFERFNDNNWRFRASDAQGCTTVTQTNTDAVPAEAERRNVRWQYTERFALGNLLLVGDCAYRFDPSCGLGMTHALKSALLAARAICQSVCKPAQSKDSLDYYARRLNEDFLDMQEALSTANR